MFIGHYAAALAVAALPRAPRLGALFVAAQLVDYAFFGFVLLGVEHMREVPGHTVMNTGDFYHMPLTHSLLGSAAFAAAWAAGTRLLGGTWRAAWLGAAVVLSHWFLDLLVHAPDLTLAGGGTRYGLALWNHPLVAVPLELGAWIGAFALYAARSTGARLPLLVLFAAMLAAQLADWLSPKTAAVVDPVPPSLPLLALGIYTALALLASWVARTQRVDGAVPAR